ncbi:Mitogen-activated protein kinase kinase kinase [Melia azedarach]|uniref:Mitogen-activated protein kinase kinase kinase n=1 Tax=Melia azedarach TaxID=155640 RepID=A0ACC1YPD9_MELAZ|nr:Mitogen-activated protein kinase kinase kinase [Melia azedarach]
MNSWIRGKCIGKGSFGAVNVAVNKLNGDVFVVKSVDRNACHPAQIESLENEIRILRSLSSPYVVKYLGDDESYESPTTSYRNLHMEYLPGGTATDLAITSATYGEEKVLRSQAYCIVSALRYLHSCGIVHCDVKGKNILVSSSSGFAKLADFGSAGEISDGVKILPRGSPLWMAPEVVRGEYQGPESDVWSLGCTIIEMVTGKPAWEDFGAHTLTRIGLSNELPRFPTQLSELGRDFLEKCLRRQPSERWSCDQLLQHPFLQSASPSRTITEPSPRCVLDWVNSEFEEEDTDVENFEASARERIGKLATSSGEIWESDGWVEVRCSEKEEAEEGRRREYSNLMITKDEAPGTSSVYADSQWTNSGRENWEEKKIGGSEGGCCGGYPSCRYGYRWHWQKAELAVEMKEMGIYNYRYRMCDFKLLLLLLLSIHCTGISRYILMLAYGICYILRSFFFFSQPQTQLMPVSGNNRVSCSDKSLQFSVYTL